MKKVLTAISFCLIVQFGFSQIGVNTNMPDPSAALDIVSTDKGMLIPRVADTADVTSPATGLIIYNSTDNHFYYNNGTAWQQMVADRKLLSDADGDTKVLVESMPDEDVIRMELKGTEKFVFQSDSTGRSRIHVSNNRDNIGIGALTLDNNTSGERNIGIGHQALESNKSGRDNLAYGYRSLTFNTTGSNNVAIGRSALEDNNFGGANVGVGAFALANNNGFENVAIGASSLINSVSASRNVSIGNASMASNQTGGNNVAIGFASLRANTAAVNNVAIGTNAMRESIAGNSNVAVGIDALYNNTNGSNNVSLGNSTMYNNTTGSNNVALGNFAMNDNTSGIANIAIGLNALSSNTEGDDNIGLGKSSLKNNTEGNNNVAMGLNTLSMSTDGNDNVAIGNGALRNSTTGSSNVAIGSIALNANSSGQGNVALGYGAGATENASNKLYIENTFNSPDNTLIYGDFQEDFVKVNNRLSIGMPLADFNSELVLAIRGKATTDTLISCEDNLANDRFEVYSNGNAWLSGTLTEASDRRLKKNITPLSASLSGILKLNGYNYDWKDINASQELQTGVIAQEVLEVFPELVAKDKKFLSVNYIGLIPHLIEGIKDQQETIEQQNNDLEQMRSEIESMKVLLEELATKIENE